MSNKIQSTAISSIAKLSSLKSLTISGEYDAVSLFQQMSQQEVIPPLKTLNLTVGDWENPNLPIDPIIGSLLPFADTLTSFCTGGNVGTRVVDEEYVAASFRQFTKMQRLYFSYSISPQLCASVLSAMPRLEYIWLSPDSKKGASEAMTPIFQAVGTLEKLQSLDISVMWPVVNEDFGYLSTTIINSIYLQRVVGFDDGVVPYIQQMKRLTRFSEVKLHPTDPLSKEAMTELQTTMQLQS
jgi:hypothetical protein